MSESPFPRFITINGALTLRITHGGEIKQDIPVSARTAALLVSDGAHFLMSKVTDQTNQPEDTK